MSYNFGQFRRGQIKSYLTTIPYELSTIEVESPLSKGVVFTNPVMNFSENNLLSSIDDSGKQKGYYLKFKIYKQEKEQLITLKLIDTQKTTENTQIIKDFKIEAGLLTDSLTFEIIIAPNSNYNQICFELNRTMEDYNTTNTTGTSGRLIQFEIEKIAHIYNIINYLNPSINNLGKLKQIGVQGPTGLLMCINGEEIRIGRTGIYEINYGISINSIGFIIEENDNKNFLLDYQY